MTEPVARVQVSVTLRVTTSAAWGGACTVAQAQSQGREAAKRVVERLLSGELHPGEKDAVEMVSIAPGRVIIEDA